MKKTKFLASLLTFAILFNFSNVSARTTDLNNQAIACGHAMSSMMIAVNNLSNEDFCTMRNTILNGSLTDSAKFEILDNTPGLLAFRNTVVNAGSLFQQNYFEGMFNEGTSTWYAARNACLIDLGYDLTNWDTRPDADPCNGYKIQTNANIKTFAACLASVSIACGTSTFAYALCWIGGASYCAYVADVQQRAINQSYPGCVGSYSGATVIWKSWLTTDQLNPNINCTFE